MDKASKDLSNLYESIYFDKKVINEISIGPLARLGAWGVEKINPPKPGKVGAFNRQAVLKLTVEKFYPQYAKYRALKEKVDAVFNQMQGKTLAKQQQIWNAAEADILNTFASVGMDPGILNSSIRAGQLTDDAAKQLKAPLESALEFIESEAKLERAAAETAFNMPDVRMAEDYLKTRMPIARNLGQTAIGVVKFTALVLTLLLFWDLLFQAGRMVSATTDLIVKVLTTGEGIVSGLSFIVDKINRATGATPTGATPTGATPKVPITPVSDTPDPNRYYNGQ